jgi:6-phosphogluconolactonase
MMGMPTRRQLFAQASSLLSTPFLASAAKKSSGNAYWVYIGCYTNNKKSTGIQLFQFDAAGGKLTSQGIAGEVSNPSFVDFHPTGKYLYAVSEIANLDGQKTGAVSAFSIDRATGKLTTLNRMPSRGAGPCHVRVDATGRMLVVANYSAGSTASLPIKPDGSLGEAVSHFQFTGSGADPRRQREPHAHSATFSPDNRFVVVADLGTDKLMVFRADPAKASMTPNDPPFFSTPPASGPRHFAFHPKGKYAYVINELASTVTAMSYDKARGAFQQLETVSTLPPDYKGDTTTAEVKIHPNGKFLYGSNRGHDSIAVFSIASTGKLKLLGHTSTEGKVPRNFSLDPAGKWLIAANQNTDNLVVFRVDPSTGKLSPTGQNLPAGAPVCVKFLPFK